jgi:DNA polymerase-3 subunit gamma/tau
MQAQDLASTLLLYDDINRKGFEGDLVINGFAEFLRNVLVCKDEKVVSLLEVVESFKERYFNIASRLSTAYIISALNILNEAEINYKAARNKKLHVELALIKLCYLKQAIEITSGEAGLNKKKQVESNQPLAFKKLQVVEAKLAAPKVKTELKPLGNETPANPVDEARLIIETDSMPRDAKKRELSNTPVDVIHCEIPVEVETEKQAISSRSINKLGALNKIRERYQNTGQGTETKAHPLVLEELQVAWKNFTDKLREAKNPAVQSFERASLRVVDNNLFEITSGNNLEQKFIEQQRLNLCEHLQVWFNNKALSYCLSIGESAEIAPVAEEHLNSRQQFQKLAEQYPLVKELKDRLRLELDY